MCCGGVLYLRSYIASAVSQQPAEVQAISDEIVTIHAAPLEPVAGGRFRIPFVDKTLGQGVVYADKNHKSILVLGSFGEVFGKQFQDQFLEGLEKGQFQNGPANKNKNQEELKDIKKTQRERMIHGEKAVFEIKEGVGVQSNKKKIRVQGAFEGKTGPAIFILDAEEESLPLDKVEKIIDSIE
jgi:hypothetical protein